MSEQNDRETGVNRRQFLAGATTATVAAITVGGGLGLINRSNQPVSPTTVPATATPIINSSSQVANQAQQLANQQTQAQLAAVQAENMRLQAELDGVLRRLETSERLEGEARETISTLQIELANSQEKTGLIAGLVALYEQLDEIDIDDTVSRGLTRVSEAFQTLTDDLPVFADGLDQAEILLGQFEAEAPSFMEARRWLDAQMSKLANSHGLIDMMLQRAIDRVGPVLELLQAWFDDILKWLPFGLGRRSADVMAAMTDLMQQTPETIEGAQRYVVAPLNSWFHPEVGETDPAIKGRLFKPLREKTIETSRRKVDQVKQTQDSYRQELVGQVAASIADRQIQRMAIDRYRRENNLE